jgi:hypothetical protein
VEEPHNPEQASENTENWVTASIPTKYCSPDFDTLIFPWTILLERPESVRA